MRIYKVPHLGKFLSVENFDGKPNQFIIKFDKGTVLQSYNSIIAIKTEGKTYLGQNWDYSNTTGKYRNMFLYEDTKETREKLNHGEYKLLEV